MNGVVTLNRNGVISGGGVEFYDSITLSPCNPAIRNAIHLKCDHGTWTLTTNTASPPKCYEQPTPLAPVSVSPTAVVWTLASLDATDCGSGPFTFTLSLL